MVPGQSLVLYSRLHLVLYNQRILHTVLYIIIASTVCVLLLTTTTIFGSAYIQTSTWKKAYDIVERLQLTWFCVQEFLIPNLYIWEAVKLLRLSPERDNHRKKIMYELLLINLIIIVLDVPVPVLEYVNFYYLEVSLKPTIYSIKLRLEFAILGRLVSIISHRHEPLGSGLEDHLEFSAPRSPPSFTLHSGQGPRKPQCIHMEEGQSI